MKCTSCGSENVVFMKFNGAVLAAGYTDYNVAAFAVFIEPVFYPFDTSVDRFFHIEVIHFIHL